MNITLPQSEVTARCSKAGVAISAIEELPTGGTHLVTVTSDGAAAMRRAFKNNLIEGRVQRFAFMHAPTRPAG